MRLLPPKHVYLFHHVGKCAGTSLVQAFGQTGRAGICLGFQCHRKDEVRRQARRALIQRRISPRRIRIFFGHRVYYGLHHLCPQPPRYFTFLRHPVDRVISLYNYHCDIALNPTHQHHQRDRLRMLRGDRPIAFDEWLDNQYTGNHLVRFLSYAMQGELVHVPRAMTPMEAEAARRFLDHCWFIGFAESSRDDIPLVCRAVGVRPPQERANVSGSHFSSGEMAGARALIESRDALDVEVFQYARQLRSDN